MPPLPRVKWAKAPCPDCKQMVPINGFAAWSHEAKHRRERLGECPACQDCGGPRKWKLRSNGGVYAVCKACKAESALPHLKAKAGALR